MSVFLMGCYNPANQKWCTVTKVHTGHDDKTLERLQVGDRLYILRGLTPWSWVERYIHFVRIEGLVWKGVQGLVRKWPLKVITWTKSHWHIVFLRGPTSLYLAVLTEPADLCPEGGGIVLPQNFFDIAQHTHAVSLQEQEQHQLHVQG